MGRQLELATAARRRDRCPNGAPPAAAWEAPSWEARVASLLRREPDDHRRREAPGRLLREQWRTARIVAIRMLGAPRGAQLGAAVFGERASLLPPRAPAVDMPPPAAPILDRWAFARARGLAELVFSLHQHRTERQLAVAALAAAEPHIAGAARSWLGAGGYTFPRPHPGGAGIAPALRVAGERRAATLFRAESTFLDEADPEHPAVAAALAARGGGGALPPALRLEMEALFGIRFGWVRIHRDRVAAAAAQAVRARAFTVGEEIFFAAGAWSPGSAAGRRLVAHELTHVAQGYRGQIGGPWRISRPDELLEREAEAMAEAVARSPRRAGRQEAVARAAEQPSAQGLLRSAGAEYHGVGGWIHHEILEPLQRDYQAWMRWGLQRSAVEGERLPGVGHVAGALEGFVPYVLGAAGSIVVGVAQLVVPKSAEEHFLFVAVPGMGPAVDHLATQAMIQGRYGLFWLRRLFVRRPAVKARLQELGLLQRVEKEAQAQAPQVIRRVTGRLREAKGGPWSATKSKTAIENAFAHWKKHGAEFPGLQNAKQYVEHARRFMGSPPPGTLTKVRPNGARFSTTPAAIPSEFEPGTVHPARC